MHRLRSTALLLGSNSWLEWARQAMRDLGLGLQDPECESAPTASHAHA